MSHNVEKDVLCPFFKESPSNGYVNKTKEQARAHILWEKTRIRCEGIIEGTQLITQFLGREARYRYKKEYCACFNYLECPIYKMLDKKYT